MRESLLHAGGEYELISGERILVYERARDFECNSMIESEQTKVCPLCAETIKVAAKVCPHCRHWQKLWSLRNPWVGGALWIIMVFVALICFETLFEGVFGPKAQFASHRDEVSVVSSQFSHRVSESNLLVTVVGTLTNRGSIAWKNVSVEAQFLNKSGKLIDAITADADFFRRVTILPHGQAAFKIEDKAARPQSDYDSYTVVVRWAKDAHEWP